MGSDQKTSRPVVWSIVVTNLDVAQALGESYHFVPVRVFGLMCSRAAFARALLAVGLEHGSEVNVSRRIAEYGSVSRNVIDVATATDEDVVYVTSVNSRRRSIRWPQVSQ